MPTKSGRVKLKDLRQGKTIYKPTIGPNGTWVAKAFFVVHGVTKRVVGLRLDEKGALRNVWRWMFSLSPRYVTHYNVFSTFHPHFQMGIKELPDGSLVMVDGFVTYRACMRWIQNVEAGRIEGVSTFSFIHERPNPHNVTKEQIAPNTDFFERHGDAHGLTDKTPPLLQG